MVLDGLDEIPEPARASAVSRINQVLHAGQPLIVSSRIEAYRSAVRPTTSVEVTLTGAAGIELCSLGAEEVVTYLQNSAGGPAGKRRWEHVAATLINGSVSALSQAMTTPLMVSMARTIYNPRPDEPLNLLPDPNSLLSLSTRQAIEQNLFDGFIPAAYRNYPTQRMRWRTDKALKWLSYLAYHLEQDHHGTPDLAWWRLRSLHTIPSKGQALAVGGIISLIAGLFAIPLYRGVFSSTSFGISFGLQVAAVTGLVYGIVYWLTYRLNAALSSALIVAIGGGPALSLAVDALGNDPFVQIGMFSLDVLLSAGIAAGFIYPLRPGAPVGLKAGIWVAVIVAPAYWFTAGITSWLTQEPASGISYGVPDALVAGLLVGLVTWVRTSQAHEASRIFSPIVSGTLAALVIGLGVGLAYGLTGGAMVGISYGVSNGIAAGALVGLVARVKIVRRSFAHSRVLLPIVAGTLMALATGSSLWVLGPDYGIAYGLMYGLVIGVLVGLVARVKIVRRSFAHSRVLLPIVAGTLMALATGSSLWVIDGRDYGITYGLIYGLAAGILVALVARLASSQSITWLNWTIQPILAGLGYAVFYLLMVTPTCGLVVGLTVGLAVELTSRLNASRGPARGLNWTSRGLLLGAFAGLVAGIITGHTYRVGTGLAIGVIVWCVVGITFGVDTPRGISATSTPRRVLGRDRLTFLVITFVIALAIAGAVDITLGEGNQFEVLAGLIGGITYGLATGATVAAGHTVWARYGYIRCRLALAGRLPWAFMAFLNDANIQHGVLRQNGATYQFRHVDLQRRLAARYASHTK